MTTHLVIVESPSKATTISKYLGDDYDVLASYGHVRDLKPKTGAVDTENDFKMEYVLVERNEKHVREISSAMKKADSLLLATDPDREGEAISWHIYELLKEKGLLKNKTVKRVVFHEITKTAVRDAVANPRELSNNLINAQQARRALDYLVGFNLSPMLWKKVSRGLSAGRVQSPALRMISERESEIEAFKPREYWTILASLEHKGSSFEARLTHLKSDKLQQFTITNAEQAHAAQAHLNQLTQGKLTASSITHKERKRNPVPPFTTSTLQQEASRKLGYSAKKTMMVAQSLYEGIKLQGEMVGLITYMRTDSVDLAKEAIEEIRAFVLGHYGDNNLPEKPNNYQNKSKNAQEAHEAIRPTSVLRSPETVGNALTKDQRRLYDLIWKRSVASQMLYATLNTTAIDFTLEDGSSFRVTGTTIVNPGFMAVYLEDEDDSKEEKEQLLPDLKEGDVSDLKEVITNQHFTEPPPRYTEASLIKALEFHGIGRPSTYVSILTTLINRGYAEMDGKRFMPTDTGRVVNTFLSNHFTQYVDYDFTAKLEDDLDAISRGEVEWTPVLKKFWEPFKELLDDKEVSVTREEAVQSRQLGSDPKSGKPVSVRLGRFGPMVQIGTKDDEEKPKFAGLRPGQKMDTITYDEAMELFKLPRKLGETAEGEKVSANIGRFGPYLRYNDKYVSLKEDDPFTIELDRALILVAEKKIVDANKIIMVFEEQNIQVLNGRYGPYITDGEKNAKIPKDQDPKLLTLEQCQTFIAEAPFKKGKKKATKKAATKKVTKKATKKKVSKKKTTKKVTKKTTKKVTKKKATKKATTKKVESDDGE